MKDISQILDIIFYELLIIEIWDIFFFTYKFSILLNFNTIMRQNL